MKTLLLATVASIAFRPFMSDTCETVLVKTKGGEVRINKSDYDANPDQYALASKTKNEENAETDGTRQTTQPTGDPLPEGVQQAPTPGAPVPVTPQTPAPNARHVMKDGRRVYVVDNQGKRVEGEGIDHEKGYANEAEAWNAIMKAPQSHPTPQA